MQINQKDDQSSSETSRDVEYGERKRKEKEKQKEQREKKKKERKEIRDVEKATGKSEIMSQRELLKKEKKK